MKLAARSVVQGDPRLDAKKEEEAWKEACAATVIAGIRIAGNINLIFGKKLLDLLEAVSALTALKKQFSQTNADALS